MSMPRAPRALVLLTAAALASGPAARAATPAGPPGDASRLLDAAESERAALEGELAGVLDEYVSAANEADAAARRLSRTEEAVAAATREAVGMERRIADEAATAYMAAVSGSPVVVLDSVTTEEAIVTVEMLSRVHSGSVTELAALVGHLDQLDDLRADHSAQLDELASRRAALSRQSDRLGELLAEADAKAAAAYAAASQAEAASRADAATKANTEESAADEGRGAHAATSAGSRSVESWRPAVARYFPSDLVEDALAIMACESRGDPSAVNTTLGAAGLYQFLPGTWAVASSGAGVSGSSALDGEANIAAAAWLADYYRSRTGDPWRPWGCRSVL